MEVEYALQNAVQPMGVSTYTVKEQLPEDVLPTKNKLNEILQRDKLMLQ